MIYINESGKHNEVWLDKPYATITVECPECPSREDAYSSGWTDGSEDGYHKGYPSGYTDGYDSGYTDGLSACSGGSCEEEWQDGYDSGYTDGSNSVDCTDFYNSGVTDGIAEQKAKLVSTAITQNGTYTKEDGFSSVEVNVPTGQTINNQNISRDILASDLVYAAGHYMGNQTITHLPYYTGIEKVDLSIDINASAAIEQGYNSGYTDGLNACSGGNEDLIANLQGDYFVIPEGTTKLRNYAFYGTSLSSITIPSTVTEIGAGAFSSSNLTGITIPNSVSLISSDAFAGTGIEEITIPDTVLFLGTGVLQNTYSLTAATLPSGLTSIPSYMFRSSRLPGITLPTGITQIGLSAFGGCSLTGNLNIPAAVTGIGANAFANVNTLSSMTFESTVPAVLSGTATYNASLGSTAYTWPIYVPCEAVDTYKTAWPIYAHRIECKPDNTSVLDFTYVTSANNQTINLFQGDAQDSNSFFKAFYSAITFMEIDGTVVYPNPEDIEIYQSGDEDRINLYTHSFAQSGSHTVKFYMDKSFSASTSTGTKYPAYELTELIFASNSAIKCPITEATIGDGYEYVHMGVFQGSDTLTSATIPSSVTAITNFVFENSALKTLTCNRTTHPSLGVDVFNGANALEHIYVPASAVEDYKAATNWSNYASIISAIQ